VREELMMRRDCQSVEVEGDAVVTARSARSRIPAALLLAALALSPGEALATCPEKNDIQGEKKPEKPIKERDECREAAGFGNVGEPINVHSGNVFFNHIDMSIRGFGGRTLVLARTYNSEHAFDGRVGAFGRGWSHTFEQVLWFHEAPAILAIRTGGGLPVYYHDYDEDSVYRALVPATEMSRVEAVAGVGYIRRFPNGSSETFDGAGRWVAAADAAGNTTTLARDGAGRLVRITEPGGRFLAFEYENGLVARLAGPLGEIARYVYDPTRMLKDVIYSDGSGYKFTYNDKGQMLLVTDQAGLVIERHEYEGKKGTLSEIADGQERLTLQYDEFHTTVTDALGAKTVYDYSPIWGRNHITRITHPEGESQDWTYDDQGRLVSYKNAAGTTTIYEYDPLGRRTAETNEYGAKTRYTYTIDDRVETVSTPDGVVRKTVYGPHGPLELVTAAGGRSRVDRTEYDSRGLPTRVIDSGGRATVMTYEANGDLKSVTDPAGRVVEYGYDEVGRHKSSTVTAPTRIATTYVYDARGRLLTATRSDGVSVERQYDVHGRPTVSKDGKGRTTFYGYDTAGRLATITDPLGGVTRYTYDVMSRRTSVVDASDRATTFLHDRNGRVTQTTFPDGATEQSTYDRAGRLAKSVDRRGVTSTYVYDAAGRLLRASPSDGSPSVSFGYDTSGRRVFAVNDADFLTWAYGPFGEIQSEASRRHNTKVAYTYGDAGQLVAMSLNGVGQVGLEYDGVGRLSRLTHAAGAFDFEYDLASRRRSMRYPNGVVTQYEFDALGRVSQVGASLGNAAISRYAYTHDVIGNRLSKAGLDDSETYGYDDLSRLVEVVRPSLGRRWSHSYDAVGNRIGDESPTGSSRYEYEVWNRLVRREGGGTARVRGAIDEPGTVSLNGNAAPVDGASFEGTVGVPPGGGQVDVSARDQAGNEAVRSYSLPASGSVEEFEYDANGAMVRRTAGPDEWVYEWTARQELKRVLRNGVEIARFAYDPLGRRVEKVAANHATSYVYAGTAIIRETAASTSGSRSWTYVHGPGIDEPLARRESTTGTMTYYHSDALGSIVATTDGAGAVTSRRKYDAWGNLEMGQVENGYSFTGREWDPEIGLYYYRARYYDPALGRFLSEDPIGFAAGLHFYAYVGNNPVNFRDPLGLFMDPTSREAMVRAAEIGGPVIRPPDFASFNASFSLASLGMPWASFGINVTVDNHFNIYSAPTASGGASKGLLKDLCSVSLEGGWMLRAAPPSSSTLQNYLSGVGNEASAYGPFGGGVTWNDSGAALLLGVGSPQAGYARSYATVTPSGFPDFSWEE
jgi:RHS repeat-associated protein